MTVKQLSIRYQVTPRAIRRDCSNHIYPYTVRRDGSNGQKHWKIKPYIPFYSRQTWIKLAAQPATTYGQQEYEAFILTNGHKLSTRAIAMRLLISTDEVRRIYSKLYDEGKVQIVYADNSRQTIF